MPESATAMTLERRKMRMYPNVKQRDSTRSQYENQNVVYTTMGRLALTDVGSFN